MQPWPCQDCQWPRSGKEDRQNAHRSIGIVSTREQRSLQNICTNQNIYLSDAAGAQGISAVTDGINNAQAGISTIAKALLTGQTAPADARQQVEDGLVAAGSALSNITSYVL